MKEYLSKNWKIIITFVFGMILTISFANFLIIQKNSKYIYDVGDEKLENINSNINVGIVFGGAINKLEPSPLLRDRLNKAAELIELGIVDKLLLSGDSSQEYNEPQVMYKYLVEVKSIEPEVLKLDTAGRSTYESCERAKKVYNLNEAILISESVHLPRAIYLCRHFGIDSYGIASTGDSISGLLLEHRWREVLARNKAVYNIYVNGEKTALEVQ